MIDIYIIAAGLGTRMGGVQVPKALIEIDGVPNLLNTLQKITFAEYVGNVYVVSNTLAREKFHMALCEWKSRIPHLVRWEKVYHLPIQSGLGDGHAVYEAIRTTKNCTNKEPAPNVIILWGDAYVYDGKIVSELIEQGTPTGWALSGYIPVVREDDPYVTILVSDAMEAVSADFSKFGERHAAGFHDQSIFYFDTSVLLAALNTLHSSMFKGGRYISETKDLNFLHVLHYLYNSGNPASVYQTEYPISGYNTMAEAQAIDTIAREKK